MKTNFAKEDERRKKMKDELIVTKEMINLEAEITGTILEIWNSFSWIVYNKIHYKIGKDDSEFIWEPFEKIKNNEDIPTLLRNLKRYFQERD